MKEGTIIKLEYDAWIVETKELFDTTNEEHAKEEDIYNENIKYQPQSIIIGAKTVVKGLDDALKNAEPGKEYELEIPPDDAYGQRDLKLVELHTKREIMRLPEFRKGDKDPQVGMQIALKGKVGTITAITAGRIRVDFNNKLAGRTLRYKYKVTSSAETTEDKIYSILEIHYGTSEGFKAELKDDLAEITIPDTCKYDQAWYLAKHRVVTDIQGYTDISNVRLTEEYTKKEPAAEAAPEKGDTAEAPADSGGDTVNVETSDKNDSGSVKFSIDQDVQESGDEDTEKSSKE
jgi:FKBP-type peptidyl-prolyl cis-trans isomerase 2